MRESNFSTEVVESLEKCGAWAFKIPDMPFGKADGALTTFNPEKPCDIVASFRGRSILIEDKLFKKWKSFTIRDLRASQISNLNRAHKKGGSACFVFVNLRMKGINRLIYFEWEWLRKKLLADGKIGIEELKTNPYIDGKGGVFDMSRVLKLVI